MNKLYVGNLPFGSTEDGLSQFAQEQGVEVAQVNIITDMHTGRSRGFGFIELAESQDLQAAISALNGKEFEGRPLRVDRAKERSSGGRPGGYGGWS